MKISRSRHNLSRGWLIRRTWLKKSVTARVRWLDACIIFSYRTLRHESFYAIIRDPHPYSDTLTFGHVRECTRTRKNELAINHKLLLIIIITREWSSRSQKRKFLSMNVHRNEEPLVLSDENESIRYACDGGAGPHLLSHKWIRHATEHSRICSSLLLFSFFFLHFLFPE